MIYQFGLDFLGVDEQVRCGGDVVLIREAKGDPIVAPDNVDRSIVSLAEAGGQSHGPRGMHLGSEGRQQHDPPVADLIAEALHDDRVVRG